MSEMIRELFSPELAFLRCALLVGLVGGVSMGIVGTMVVTRRITSIAGAEAGAPAYAASPAERTAMSPRPRRRSSAET